MSRRQASRVGAVVALALASTSARAGHDHHHHAPSDPSKDESKAGSIDASNDLSTITASVGAIVASYRSRLYEGDYQGGSLGASYARGRFELAVQGLAYQIDRNGKTYRGFGDLMVHAAAQLFERDAFAAGAHVMVMAPTGDAMTGLGMGHWMLMPAAWATYSTPAVALSGALGYARGLASEDTHAAHGGGGAWPLVDPMSVSEVTFDASAMVPLADTLAVGARVLAAVPTDDDTRAIGAARVSWRAGRVVTTGEFQVGIVGDPVRLRGLISTAMSF